MIKRYLKVFGLFLSIFILFVSQSCFSGVLNSSSNSIEDPEFSIHTEYILGEGVKITYKISDNLKEATIYKNGKTFYKYVNGNWVSLFEGSSSILDADVENGETYTYTMMLDDFKAVSSIRIAYNGVIDRKYWGSWIRMDSGEEFYINAQDVYKRTYKTNQYNQSNQTETYTDAVVAYPLPSYSFDGENIITNGNIYYFRKGGSNRNFSATISGLQSSSLYNSIRLQELELKP